MNLQKKSMLSCNQLTYLDKNGTDHSCEKFGAKFTSKEFLEVYKGATNNNTQKFNERPPRKS